MSRFTKRCDRRRLFGALVPVALVAALVAPAAVWARQSASPVAVVGVKGPTKAIVFRSLGGSYLGVGLVDITPELRDFYGAREEAGVLISRVEDESPAATAGLRVGDVITAVEGEAAASASTVARLVRRFDPEDEVQIDVVRAGAPETLTATLGERERGRWFDETFGSGQLEALGERDWLHLDLDALNADAVFRQFLVEGEASDAMRRAFEKAREQLDEVDFAAIQERLKEAEKRLHELEAQLREQNREEREEKDER